MSSKASKIIDRYHARSASHWFPPSEGVHIRGGDPNGGYCNGCHDKQVAVTVQVGGLQFRLCEGCRARLSEGLLQYARN